MQTISLKKYSNLTHVANCGVINDPTVYSSFRYRQWTTSLAPVLATVWQPMSWVYVIVIMIISWSRNLVTCSTSTLERSLAMPRCLEALRGDKNVV